MNIVTTSILSSALLASSLFAQVQTPGGSRAYPLPSTAQILDDFYASALASKTEGELILELADDYLEVVEKWTNRSIAVTSDQVLFEAFGSRLNQGQSGIYSNGFGGPNALQYRIAVEHEFGRTAPIQDLELVAFDMSHPAFTGIARPVGWNFQMQGFLYKAKIGDGPEHLGSALRFYDSSSSFMVFAPGVRVPDASLISASDALAFYGETLAHEFRTQSFTEFALSRAAQTAASTSSSSPDCDIEALRNCLRNAATQHVIRQAEIDERNRNNIDEIVAEWGDGQVDSLGGWLAGGTVTGALGGAGVGSLAGGVGAIPGAITGGLIGAIGGGVGWLFDTGAKAERAREKIAEARENWQTERCQNFERTAAEMRGCAATHCPGVAAALDAWLANSAASLGC